MAEMLAGRLHMTERALRMESVPVPEPQRGEVRIRVAAAGVCLSDVHLIDLEQGDALSINGLNVLAFDSTLRYDIKMVSGAGMMSTAGLFNCVFTGQGRLAVLGPLENADLVGTDLTLAIHKTVLPDIDNRPVPSPYLEALVAKGKLGFKSGEGFRPWSAEAQAALRAKVLQHLKKARTADA